jgi:hypothetical protein
MSTILQFFYNLFHWQYFGVLAIIWIVIDLVWVKRWRDLAKRLGKLITKPVIFKKDKEPNDPPIYPREFLEQLALNSRRENKVDAGPGSGVESQNDDTLRKWRDAQRDHVFSASDPLRSLGYVISLAFFIFFLIADTIVVAATLVLMGVISPDLPPLFQRMELVEMSGKGELVNTDMLSETQKKIFKLFAATATLFAVIVMIALAVQRLISLGYLESSPTSDLILSFILYGLLAINNSLSAALTFQPAASGFIVVIYLAVTLIIGMLPLLAFLADMLWRGVYIVVDIALWVFFTPVIALPFGVASLFTAISGGEDSPKKNSGEQNQEQPAKIDKSKKG